MKAFNKSGDVIHTFLFGGETIAKDALIVDAYGTIDELNTFIGLARAKIEDKDVKDILADVQETLLNVGSDLATPLDKPVPVERIGKDKFNQLERIMEKYEKELKPINRFVIPGGSEQSALLHVARSIARRAERRLVTVKKERQINDNILIYINRLSDMLFVFARIMNKRKDTQDELWVR